MNTINVIIETPKGSFGKYDKDPRTGLMMLNKLLPKGMAFPYDFGFVVDTVGGDGDPLDVIVIAEIGTFSGCFMECRLIGAIKANQRERDGSEMRNDRLIAVPVVSRDYAEIQELNEMPKEVIEELILFFSTYNHQAGKEFKPISKVGAMAAMKLVEEGRRKNEEKSYLIQLFLPVVDSKKNQNFAGLKAELVTHFGGLTIYAQCPAEGDWLDGCSQITEKILVFEVMAGEIESDYWKQLKVSLEKKLNQKEILIRTQQIGMIS